MRPVEIRASRWALGVVTLLAAAAAPAAAQSGTKRNGACALAQARERLAFGAVRQGTLTTRDCMAIDSRSSAFEDVYRFDVKTRGYVALLLRTVTEAPGLSLNLLDSRGDWRARGLLRCRMEAREKRVCPRSVAVGDTLEAGTYYAVVSHHRYTSDATAPARDIGQYSLVLIDARCERSPADDIGLGERKQGRLGPGGCVHPEGQLNKVHTLVLPQRDSVVLTLRATDFVPRIALRRTGSESVLGDNTRAGEVRLQGTLDAGSYDVVVTSRDAYQVGAYELSAAYRGDIATGAVAATQCRPATATATIAPGQSRADSLSATSCWEASVGGRRGAYHRLALPRAQTLSIALSSTAFEPRLFLHDASGKALPWGMTIESGAATIRETLPAGTYWVFVTSRAPNATGTYRLEVK